MTQRLNIGCGVDQPSGWRNIDRVDHGQEFVADVFEGLPFPDDFADMVVANHVISDWDHHQLGPGLLELHRVIRPGGVLRVLVPDFYRAWGAYLAKRSDWFPQGDDLTDIDERFCTFATWFGTVGSVFTPKYLALLLRRAGFNDVTRETLFLSTHGPLGISELDGDRTTSLIMEGRK